MQHPSASLLAALAILLLTGTVRAQAAPPRDYTLDGPLATSPNAEPKWAANLPVYQAYPHDGWDKSYPAGSYFRRTEALLPALKEMGVGIVWLVPLHPRGPAPGALPPPHIAKTAQFQSSSPYCVRDFYAVDPHWGSPAEFKRLVRRAHALGMRVMLDMVLNHTSWGNPLLIQHPEFYKHDAAGDIEQVDPWIDIAQLDYTNRAVWDYMRDMLVHWVRDEGVDGFRMDAADRVPAEFWTWLRPQINAVRPILLLAEDEDPPNFPAFDMAYEWRLAPLLWGLAGRGADDAANSRNATDLDALLLKQAQEFPSGAVLMRHLDNHDLHLEAKSSVWSHGSVQNHVEAQTVLARCGPGYRPFTVLTATLPGKPMVYNSQETWTPGDPGLPSIPVTPAKLRSAPNFEFYRRLLNTYQQHPALYAGAFTKIPSDADAAVYAFARFRGDDRVIVVLNLSGTARTATLHSTALPGQYREVFTEKKSRFGDSAEMSLEPWAYRVYTRADRTK